MDFHLEHGLRLRTDPEHKNLYKWAINEIDAQGQQIGHDQIPWSWTLYFTATSCVLDDTIEIGSQFAIKETAPVQREIVQRQVIQVGLRPGWLRDNGDYFHETTFLMFGTNRAIKNFQLHIHPLAAPTEQEKCMAWGAVSYTTEIDFRDETTDDCIVFYMSVKPDTFARYAEKIGHGSIDEMIFSAGSVAGFYSEWSPSISTSHIKVLAKGSEQNIVLPDGFPFEPPRLSEVGEAKLRINRRLEFAKLSADLEAIEEANDIGTIKAIPASRTPAAESRTLQILESLKRAAWFAVILLALIFIVALLKHS